MMMYNYIEPKVLLIRGCYLKDCDSESDSYEHLFCTPIEEEIELPSIFTCLNSWVKSTSLACNQCKLKFDTMPIFTPTFVNKNELGYSIGVNGCFCGFNCCLKYNDINTRNICDKISKKEKIIFLHNIINSTG